MVNGFLGIAFVSVNLLSAYALFVHAGLCSVRVDIGMSIKARIFCMLNVSLWYNSQLLL